MKAWIDIFKRGAEVHRGGRRVELTEDFLDAILRNFNRLTNEGAEIVVLREHDRDGYVYGMVESLRLHEGYMQAQISFMREQDRVAFKAGMVRGFSPGFALNLEHPHTGEMMGPTLLEVSFTSMPYQQNLRPPRDTTPGVRLALTYSGDIVTLPKEEDMNNEELAAESVEDEEAAEPSEFDAKEAYSKLSERLSAIEAALAPDEEDEGSEEMSDSDRIVEELSAKVSKLEDEKTRMELDARGVTEGVEELVALKRTDADLYAKMVKLASAATVQEPIGKPGTEVVTGKVDAQTLIDKAENEGCTLSNGKLGLWLAKNGHTKRISEVTASARD